MTTFVIGLIIFLLFTFVGHLVWLIIGMVYRAVLGLPPRRSSTSTPAEISGIDRLRSDTVALERLLKYFRHKGWIEEDEAERISSIGQRAVRDFDAKRQPSVQSSAEPRKAARPSTGPATPRPRSQPQEPRPAAGNQEDRIFPVRRSSERSGQPAQFDSGSSPARSAPKTSAPQSQAPSGAPGASTHREHPAVGRTPSPERSESPHRPVSSHAAALSAEPDPLAPEAPGAARQPSQPRRALTEILQSFLAAHNIRWGEIAAGILIVVCSIGLVVSLWNTLTETNRLLPAVVFLGAVAAIEGAGLYTLRRWRLRDTSRAVLIIATMLIPLAMMAGISIAGSGAEAVSLQQPLTMAAVAVGGLVCLGMIYLSGAALVGRAGKVAWTLMIGTPTVLLPFASAFANVASPMSGWLLLAGSLGVTAGLVVRGAHLTRRPTTHLLKAAQNQFAMMLGVSLYALAVLLAMFLLTGPRQIEFLMPLGLGGLPALVGSAAVIGRVDLRLRPGLMRIVLRSLGAMGLLAALALFPPALERLEWITLWALGISGMGLAAGYWLRSTWPAALASLAVAVWAPLAVSSLLCGHPWISDFPLWRRYMGGPSMLVLLGVGIGTLATEWLVGRWLLSGTRLQPASATARSILIRATPVTIAAEVILAIAAIIAITLGVGPAAWLDGMPRAVPIGLLAVAGLVTAAWGNRQSWQRPLSAALVTAASIAAWIPIDQWWQVPFAQWGPDLVGMLVTASLGVGLCAEASSRHLPLAGSWGIPSAGSLQLVRHRRSLWMIACGAAAGAVVAAPWVLETAPRFVVAASGVSVVLLVVAALRSRWRPVIAVAQVASGVTSVLACWQWGPAWIHEPNVWRSGTAEFFWLGVLSIVLLVWYVVRDTVERNNLPGKRALGDFSSSLDGWVGDVVLALFGILSLSGIGMSTVALAIGSEPTQPHGFAVGIASLAMVALVVAQPSGWFHTLIRNPRSGRPQTQGSDLELRRAWWGILTPPVLVSTVALLVPYLFDGLALSLVAAGWVTSVLAALTIGGLLWIGRWRVPDRTSWVEPALGLVVGIFVLLIVSTTRVLFLQFASVHAPVQQATGWLLADVTGWALLGGVTLSVAGILMGRRWPIAILAIVTPISSAVLVRIWNGPFEGITAWLTFGLAGAFGVYALALLAEVTGLRSQFQQLGWTARQSASNSAPWQSPIGMLAALSAAVVVAVAIATTIGLLGHRVMPLEFPATWVVLGATMIATAAWWFRQSVGAIVVVMGSGLIATAGLVALWIAESSSATFDQTTLVMASLWIAGSILSSCGALWQKHWPSVIPAMIASAGVLAVVGWEQHESAVWITLCGIAAVWNLGLGVAWLRRTGRAQLRGAGLGGAEVGQGISVLGTVAGLQAIWMTDLGGELQWTMTAVWLALASLIWAIAWRWVEREDYAADSVDPPTDARGHLVRWINQVRQQPIVLDGLAAFASMLALCVLATRLFDAGGGLGVSSVSIAGSILACLLLIAAAVFSRVAQPIAARWILPLQLAVTFAVSGVQPAARAQQLSIAAAFLLVVGLTWLRQSRIDEELRRRTAWLRGRSPDSSPPRPPVAWFCEAGVWPQSQVAAVIGGLAIALVAAVGIWRASLSPAIAPIDAPLVTWAAALGLGWFVHRGRFLEIAAWPAACFALVAISGPGAASFAYWQILPASQTWHVMAACWSVILVGTTIWGAARQKAWALTTACMLSFAVQAIAWDSAATLGIGMWFWGLAVAFACVLGPLVALRCFRPVIGQAIGIVSAMGSLAMIEGLVPRAPDRVGFTVLLVSTQAVLWRWVAWRMARKRFSAFPNDAVPSSPLVSVQSGSRRFGTIWVDTLLFAGALLISLPAMLEPLGLPVVIDLEPLLMVAIGLAIGIFSLALRPRHAAAIGIAFVATHLLAALAVPRILPANLAMLPLAVLGAAMAMATILWVWVWPSLQFLLGQRSDQKGRGPALVDLSAPGILAGRTVLTVLAMITAAINGVLAIHGLTGGLDGSSRWLLIVAAGSHCVTAATIAEWFQRFADDRPSLAGGLRHTSVLILVFTLVLSTMGFEGARGPWWLLVTMRLVLVAVLVIPAIAWGLPRVLALDSSRWREPLRTGLGSAVVMALIALPAMFVQEWQLRGTAAIIDLPLATIVGVAVLIGGGAVGMAVAGLGIQGSQSTLPLLSSTQRRLALYAAQMLAGLAWLHIYLCRPEWALVGMRSYWPYVVLVLAFVSAGLTHWAKLRGDPVVDSTLRQTTLFLPLIPVIGFWMSGHDQAWYFVGDQVPYPLLLLAAGAFYGGLAMLWRNDRLPRVAGILLANAALWVTLVQTPSFTFAAHPQLWLIPPAVCVLAMAQVERNRLPPSMLMPIRYAATLTIYISSTADMLLGEIGASLWGPVILILLSLAGMAAGVFLRTRAFLYLGTFFVLIGVLSMVWHAGRAIEEVWPWWAFGITTGLLILTGLMAIEKNKPALQRWVVRLNAWDA